MQKKLRYKSGRKLRRIPFKIFLTMKLSALLLTLSCLQVSAEALSQNISLSVKNAPMEQVVKMIKKRSGRQFIYNDELLKRAKPVTMSVSGGSVEEVLDKCFENQPLTYELVDKTIVVKPKLPVPILEVIKEESSVVPKLEPKENSNEVIITQEIMGKVTDDKGEGLPGVSILVKGTQQGTISDSVGEFTLQIPDGNAVLIFSFVGYNNQEIIPGNRTHVNVTMSVDEKALDEVVVVGYGTQKKTSLTAAVSTMKGNEIANAPTTNLSNNLGGRMSGVIVKQGSGEPGRDGSNIYIRGISTTGSSQPLLIVDGIPRDFQQLDPSSIESFTILKDAAAVAPYGVAGANGVVLVTTKQGKSGKPTISYNGYVGFQNPTVLPEYLNGEQFANLQNVIANNSGLPRPYSDDAVQKFKDGSDPDRYPPYKNIWNDILAKRSLLQYHNIEFTGGSEKTKYYAAIGYQNQEGMWKWNTTTSNRFNLALKVESKVTNTTNIILSLNGRASQAYRPPSDRLGAESTNLTGGTARIFELISYAHPGRGALEYTNGMYGRPVIPILNGEGGYYRNNDKVLYTQLSLEQEVPFIPGLSMKGTIAYDPFFNNQRTWATPFRNASVNTSQNPYVFTNNIYNQIKPSLGETWRESSQLTYQAGFKYSKSLGLHNINLNGVFEARSNQSRSISASRINYDLFIDEISMGSSSNADMTTAGSSSVAKQIGLVYRASYDYNGKYLLEASGRYDGHYYFAPENRFGFFPAFSAGWRISEENFMKNSLNWLDNLKIRASYGEVGALAGSPFQYLSSYTVTGPGYVIDDNGAQMAIENVEPNRAITWERANKTDVGIEMAFLNGKFHLEADYFYEKRSNMLVAPDVITPPEYGIGLSQVNAGIMENRGIEFAAGFNHRFSSDIRVMLNGTFTYAKNRVLQIFETSATRDNPNRSRTGRTLGTQFGYKALGFFQPEDFDESGNLRSGIAIQPWGRVQPGDIRYDDVNGDGRIDINDHMPIGEPNQSPLIVYGFSPKIEYKNWSLDILFQGAAKTHLYHNNEMAWAFFNGQTAYVDNLNYWTPENRDAKHPRITSAPTANNTQVSSFWMQNASYLRLKSFMLSYQFPNEWSKKVGLQHIRTYISGQNNLTWTRMIYWDPESSLRGYPQQKVFSLGLNITF